MLRRDFRTPGARVVRRQVEQILGNADFDASGRSREFLRFIVEEALAGRGEALTQSAIATKVFGRRDEFDPVADPIVRIRAGRLRRSLERYYLLSGKHDSVRIELPRGGYVPGFRARHTARFALDGRVRPEEDGWQVAGRLVDLTTGEQIWGDKYHTVSKPGRWSGSLEDIARVIAARVGAEEGIIAQSLAAEHRRRKPAELTAYDAILRSYDFSLARDPEEPAGPPVHRQLRVRGDGDPDAD